MLSIHEATRDAGAAWRYAGTEQSKLRTGIGSSRINVSLRERPPSWLLAGGRIKIRAIVVQQKTGRPVQFELLEHARNSVLAWLERRGGTLDDFAFPSRLDHADHISSRQYARLVDEWVAGIDLQREDYGTHSQRQTKVSIIYKRTGNLRAVEILLGHTKIESTVRYLGVDIEDALLLAEGTEVWA